MDVLLYAMLKKRINGVASGVSNVTVQGTDLNFEFTNGMTATMHFPRPKDGVSVVDIRINDNKHLMVELSDGSITDAGLLPIIEGEPGKDGETPYIGANGNWFIGTTDTGVCATGGVSDDQIQKVLEKNFTAISEGAIEDLFEE